MGSFGVAPGCSCANWLDWCCYHVMLQDIMRLDNSARMNTPGKAAGNWAWRVGSTEVWSDLQAEATELKKLAYVYDRLPKGVEVEY